jgi:hypothetical protein
MTVTRASQNAARSRHVISRSGERGEPMVGGSLDAILFFLAHRVDALIVEDVLVGRQT